ncbi:large ribosomal subunit protein bL33m-like [Glandiceps talaboti]
MFLTSMRLAKAKSKKILVMLISAAGTGQRVYSIRHRLADKLVLRKFDKVVGKPVIFIEKKKIKSM